MLSRLMNLIRGFLSLFISGVERQNPDVLFESEKENLRKQIVKFNQGLAAHAGLCERQDGQIKSLEKEEKDLKTKATAHLKAGNREVAGQYALRLQKISQELMEKREQFQHNEATYQELLKSRDTTVKAARNKLETLKSGIDDLKVKKATAELTEMASGVITSIGSAGDNVERLQTMVEEERQKASGRVRLAKDSVDTEGVKIKEVEEKALAEQALADFAAMEGLALEAESKSHGTGAKAPAVQKTMGPTAQ